MKRGVYLAVLVTALLSLVGCTVNVGVGGYGSVSGYVQIPKNSQHPDMINQVLITAQANPPDGYEPLVGASVSISGLPNRYYQTDRYGQFFIPEVSSGSKTITVTHDSLRKDLKASIWVRANQNNPLDSKLTAGIGYYLIIGISDYKYLEDVEGPRADAELVKEALFRDNYLAGIGYSLIDRQATKSEIKRHIEKIVDHSDRSVDDYLVLYFAGRSGANFLSPYDDDEQNWGSAITDSDLEKWLREFPGDVTVIIDGSESATMADGKLFNPLALGKSKYTVITAAREGETAYSDEFRRGIQN